MKKFPAAVEKLKTEVKLRGTIRRNNAIWRKATPAQRRVLVARALVQQIECGKFGAGNGNDNVGLRELFSQTQLDLIECAFEGWGSIGTSSFQAQNDQGCPAAERFFTKYRKDKHRLIAICRNIIRNHGTFCLPACLKK